MVVFTASTKLLDYANYVCKNGKQYYIDILSFLTCSSDHTEECLPDIMWCHEPFWKN